MMAGSDPGPAREPGPVQGTGRRRRRSTAEVHSALIEAARTVFAALGYSGSTTREIAQLAGTNDILIYRHRRLTMALLTAQAYRGRDSTRLAGAEDPLRSTRFSTGCRNM